MKMKYIILALCAGQLGLSQAQETAVKEAPAKEMKKEAKPTFEAKTPLEKRALAVMNIVTKFPAILGGIKDEASADVAKAKLDEIVAKITAEAEEIKKLPVPDSATRKILSEKMKPMQDSMEKEMQAVAPKVQGIMMDFGPKMQGIGQVMEKYFSPDPETPVPAEPKDAAPKVEEKK